MKTNELRIGNLVYFNDKVVNITIGDFHIIEKESKFFKPIPLTEEWLLKFGFEKDDNFGNWHLNHLEIYKKDLSVIGIDNKGNIYWYFYAADDYYSWTQKLDYVNQLQNLYFALTGKELTI